LELTLAGLRATATPAAAHHRATAPVPAGAFLQPEDLGGVGTTPVTDDFRHYATGWHVDARQFAQRFGPAFEGLPVWVFSSGPPDYTAIPRPARRSSTSPTAR
jgi:hypothetical protein